MVGQRSDATLALSLIRPLLQFALLQTHLLRDLWAGKRPGQRRGRHPGILCQGA